MKALTVALCALLMAGCYTQSDYKHYLRLQAEDEAAQTARANCHPWPELLPDGTVRPADPQAVCDYLTQIAIHAHAAAYAASPPSAASPMLDQALMISTMTH